MKKQTKLKLNKLKISKLSITSEIKGGTVESIAPPCDDTQIISLYVCPTNTNDGAEYDNANSLSC